MEDNHPRNPSNFNKYLKPVVILVMVAVVSYYFVKHDSNQLFAFIRKYQHLSMVLSLVLYTLLGATLIPSEPLTLFLTALYGPLLAALIATVGNTFAALLEFFIGGRLGDVADFEERRARLPFHLNKIPIQSPVFILLARMLPGFGPKFVSVVCGIYKVPLRTYTWTALVSNLLGAAIVVTGGYGLLKLL